MKRIMSRQRGGSPWEIPSIAVVVCALMLSSAVQAVPTLVWNRTTDGSQYSTGPCMLAAGKALTVQTLYPSALFSLSFQSGSRLWSLPSFITSFDGPQIVDVRRLQLAVFNTSNVSVVDLRSGSIQWAAPLHYTNGINAFSRDIFIAGDHGGSTSFTVYGWNSTTGALLYSTPAFSHSTQCVVGSDDDVVVIQAFRSNWFAFLHPNNGTISYSPEIPPGVQNGYLQGTIFTCTTDYGAQWSSISAFSVASGDVNWLAKTTEETGACLGDSEGYGPSPKAPVFSHDGSVVMFVLSGHNRASIVAFDAHRGTMLWQQASAPPSNTTVQWYYPCVTGGVVIVYQGWLIDKAVGYPAVAVGSVLAFDVRTGKEVGAFHVADDVDSAPALATGPICGESVSVMMANSNPDTSWIAAIRFDA